MNTPEAPLNQPDPDFENFHKFVLSTSIEVRALIRKRVEEFTEHEKTRWLFECRIINNVFSSYYKFQVAQAKHVLDEQESSLGRKLP